MDYLGLGIRLGLRDEMTNRLRPAITELDRLERQANQTVNALNNMNGMSGFNNMYSRRLQEFNRGLQDTDVQLNHISRRLLQATGSADRFVNATNRLQGINSFQRMYMDINRVQRQIGMMSGVMSGMQRKMMDNRAFTMLNYQVKDLNDRIALTRRGIEQMNRSPNSSKFREQIALARASLAAYESELRKVNAQQHLAGQFGMRQISTRTGDAYIRPADTLKAAAASRILGAAQRDMAFASGIAYNSIKKTNDLLVGYGYTAMEAKQRSSQLAGQLTGFGMVMSQFVTLPLILATAALGKFAATFEKAQNVFHARTLVSQEQMDQLHGFKDLIEDIKIDTGATYEVTATTMAASQNILGAGASRSLVSDTTENALFMNKIWGVDSTKAIRDVKSLTKDLGVSFEQAWDIYNSGAAQANKTGSTDILDTIKKNPEYYKKQTGKGGAMDGSWDQAMQNYQMGPMEQAREMLQRMGSIIQEMWQSVEGGLGKFFGVLNRGTEAIVEFARTHPMLTKMVTVFAGIGIGLAAIAGPIALVTGFMVRYKSVIQGVNASITGLSKGGLALLSPQARMAKDRMDGLIVSIARAPQTLLSILPLLYTAIRSIPTIIGRIIRINPIFAALTAGIVAYSENWWGLRDIVNEAVNTMGEKWQGLVNAYKKSDLPAMFNRWGENMKAFGKGFADGMGIAVDMGVAFVEMVLQPLQAAAKAADPYITSLANGISKLFGGDGDFGEGIEKWKELGKYVGMVTGSLLALRGIFAITKFLISPFVSMNNSIRTVTGSVDRLITRMGLLAAATRTRVTGAVGGAAGAVSGAAGATRRFVFGNNTGSSVTSTPSIFRRMGNAAMMPFTYPMALAQRGLSRMGIGQSIFMGDRLADRRRAGLGVRGNEAATSLLRGINPAITARGSLGGTGVYGSSRGTLGRALFGQNYSTFTPVRNAQGQITGYQQNQVARTGGLLRRRNTADLGNRPNLAARMYSGAGGLMTAGMGALGGFGAARMAGMRARISAGPLGGMYRGVGRGFDRVVGSRPMGALAGAGRWAGGRLVSAGVRNPFAGALTPAAGAGRLATAGNFVARTGIGAGTMAMGAASMLGRGAVRTGAVVGGAAAGAARGVARGVGAVGRGAAAVGGGLLRAAPWALLAGFGGKFAYDKLGVDKEGNKNVGNVAGNLDKITAGIGKGGSESIKEFWDKFKKHGGDITKSVIKLIGASMKALGKQLPGMFKDAWNGIKTLAGKAWDWIEKDGGKMARATGKGLQKVLSAAWKWIRTDGIKYLGQFWNWLEDKGAPAAGRAIKKVLGAAWKWVKTDGVKILGQLFSWIWNTALPKVGSIIKKILGAAWKWVKTDGMRLLDQLFDWITGVAIPKTASWIMKQLGKAWDWVYGKGKSLMSSLLSWLDAKHAQAGKYIRDKLGQAWDWVKEKGTSLMSSLLSWLDEKHAQAGQYIRDKLGEAWDWVYEHTIGVFVDLVSAAGTRAAEMGSALWNGIVNALSGLKEKIMEFIPSVGDITGWINSKVSAATGGGGGKGKEAKKRARGGFVNSPQFSLVGEDGPEMIIPLSSKMSGISHNLFNQTAKMLGYSVSKTDNAKQSFNTAIPGNTSKNEEKAISVKQFIGGGGSGKLSNAAPKRQNRQATKPQSQDNSVKIEKIEIKFDGRIPENTPAKAKEMTQQFLRELKRKLKEERERTGNDKLTLDDLLLDY